MALDIISKINLDMKSPNAEKVYAEQYDSGGHIIAQLLNSGEKWIAPTGVSAIVLYRKSDNIGGYYDATYLSEIAVSFDSDRSIITIAIDPQMLTTAGNVNVQVSFIKDHIRISTFAFLLQVNPSVITTSNIKSKWFVNLLYESNIVVDDTLSMAGYAADSKTTGDAINNIEQHISSVVSSLNESISSEQNRAQAAEDLKVNKPITSPNGTSGQILRTLGNGQTEWVTHGTPTIEQVGEAVTDWLNDHPEATTTVEDESLTNKKLVKGTLGFVTPEMYGAVGDGITDDYQAFVDCFNSGNVVRIPEKSYYIGTNIINSSVIVEEDHGIYVNIKPLYKKEFRIDSLNNFGFKTRVAFDDANTSYSEGMAYNTNNNKIAVVFRIFTPEEKTKLYILNKDTFAIEQSQIYDISIPNALDYDFATDEYWISCYNTNEGTHRINATTLEYIGLLEVPSGYSGIYWLHDRVTKTYLHSRRDDLTNRYIYELFDESFNLLLTGSFEFQEENEAVHQGWKMFDGKLYQVSWYSLVEVDIVSGKVNRLITNGMREIEDICFLPDGIGYIIAHDVGGANGVDWFYEFNKNEKCKNTYQDQVANAVSLTDIDLNNLTADGKYYVKLTDPSSWANYHFPAGYSSGFLINMAVVSTAIDIVNFISFFIPDGSMYKDKSTSIDYYSKFIFVRFKNTNKGNMQWELLYNSTNSNYLNFNNIFSYNEMVSSKNMYGSFQGGLLMIDGWMRFSGNIARNAEIMSNLPKNTGANVRGFLYDETTKQIYLVVWNTGGTALLAEEAINDTAGHYMDLIGIKGFCDTKTIMNKQ